jgi:hypothetical protein
MPAALGLGLAPLGLAPYGLGTPATTPPLGGAPLTDAQGVRQSARKIDLATRRYVYDATGRAVGDSPVHQQMQLIATTDAGSSAVLAMGNTIKTILDITPNFVQRVRSVYTAAYAGMVARGLIRLGDITVEVTPPSKSLTRIRYTDLTIGQDQELTL